MSRPKQLSLHLVLWSILLSSCGQPADQSVRARRQAAGGAYYGGLLRMSVADDIRSIFPHNIVDATAFNLMNQVYEGLMAIDPDSREIVPNLAERHEVSSDGRTHRFYLRKGVMYHEDNIFGERKSREVTPEDVAHCFRRLCEPGTSNQLYAFAIDVIKGGRAHYEKGASAVLDPKGPEGIRVLPDGAIEIELEFPMPNFTTLLTHPCFWIFPKELYAYGKEIDSWSIGTGPFKARTVKVNDVIILERNQSYWRSDEEGNPLPYLDAIRCNFIGSPKAQLSAFIDGNLDLILQVPYSEVGRIDASLLHTDDMKPGFKILTSPGLRVEYYGFQHRSPVYGNELVRKAFNYAVDRKHIVDAVLKGYAIPAEQGFVPTSMPGFESKQVKGFTYHPDSARMLLAAAGYPNGEGFPVVTIQLNDGNETALAVADEMQRMLSENLNLTIELAVIARQKHYDLIEQGSVDFWRDGWIADYPDPENFLKLFHGKLVPEDSVKASYLNTVRFKDAAFDAYFEAALRESDRARRVELYLKADQEVINHAAVVPLYYEKWIWLCGEKVQNLRVGILGELDLSDVYFYNAGKSPNPPN